MCVVRGRVSEVDSKAPCGSRSSVSSDKGDARTLCPLIRCSVASTSDCSRGRLRGGGWGEGMNFRFFVFFKPKKRFVPTVAPSSLHDRKE